MAKLGDDDPAVGCKPRHSLELPSYFPLILHQQTSHTKLDPKSICNFNKTSHLCFTGIMFAIFLSYIHWYSHGPHDWLGLRMLSCLWCQVFLWIWFSLSPNFSIQIYPCTEYTDMFPGTKCHKHWQPLHGLKSNILWPHWLLDFNLLSQCTVISAYLCHSLKHISKWNSGRLSCLLRTGALTFCSWFFFSICTLKLGSVCVRMYRLWPSEYVDLLIPIFIHTCTDINFNQGKLRWNTNKRGVVRHDISFMDVAEKINVWASSLSITTFHYWGTMPCVTTHSSLLMRNSHCHIIPLPSICQCNAIN